MTLGDGLSGGELAEEGKTRILMDGPDGRMKLRKEDRKLPVIGRFQFRAYRKQTKPVPG